MTEDFLNDFLNEDSSETINLNFDKIKENLAQYDNEKLCDMIVCDRYFGFEKKISSICMEELSKRRLAGDTFIFEDYIEKSFNELPTIDLSMPDLQTVLNQAIGRKINGK